MSRSKIQEGGRREGQNCVVADVTQKNVFQQRRKRVASITLSLCGYMASHLWYRLLSLSNHQCVCVCRCARWAAGLKLAAGVGRHSASASARHDWVMSLSWCGRAWQHATATRLKINSRPHAGRPHCSERRRRTGQRAGNTRLVIDRKVREISKTPQNLRNKIFTLPLSYSLCNHQSRGWSWTK